MSAALSPATASCWPWETCPAWCGLVVTNSGAEIARLTAPEPNRLLPFCFTADGRQLLTVGTETRALYVFDLPAIRAGLAELDLDWDAPPLPAALATPAPTGCLPLPLAVHFELGDLPQWAAADTLVKQATQQIRSKRRVQGAGNSAASGSDCPQPRPGP